MKLAVEVEMSLTDFWDITPAELNVYAAAYFERQKQQIELKQKQDIALALTIRQTIWGKGKDMKSLVNKLKGEEEIDYMAQYEKAKAILYGNPANE